VGVEPTSKQGISEFSTCFLFRKLIFVLRPGYGRPNLKLILCFLATSYKRQLLRFPFGWSLIAHDQERGICARHARGYLLV